MRKKIFKNKNRQEKLDYLYIDWLNKELIYGKKRLGANNDVIFLLTKMDGKTENQEIKQRFIEKFGAELNDADFKRFVKQCRDYHLLSRGKDGRLVSKLSSSFMDKQTEIFQREKIRPAQYVGICYSNRPKKLNRDLENYFATIDSSRLEKLTKGIKRLKGIIVPHSNLELSGPCAAWAYKAMAQLPLPELLIILAPNHSGTLVYPFSVLNKDFRLLPELVKVDRELINLLSRKNNYDIFYKNIIHLREHAIEVQLPFLKYIYKEDLKRLKIVPIICARSSYNDSLGFSSQRKEFIEILREAIVKTGKNTLVIATGDLVHNSKWRVGPYFHQRNREIITLLRQANPENLKTRLSLEHRSCGKGAFYSFLKLIGPAKAKILNYSWASKSSFLKKREDLPYRNLMNIGYVSMIFY